MQPLARARQIVDEIYQTTSTIVLTGDKEMTEPEVEAFISLIDSRQLLIDELTDLRGQLGANEMQGEEFAQIRRILADINSLDISHQEAISTLLGNVKTMHRDTKQKQVLNRAYAQIAPGPISGIFDRSD